MEKSIARTGSRDLRRQARPQGRRSVRQSRAALLGNRAVEDGTGLAQKKVRDWPVKDRRRWVDLQGPMALIRQCELAGVARSTIYAPHFVAIPDEMELLLLTLIDAEYTRHPFYGSRKMVVHLATKGHPVNRKRVQRLMGVLGLAGMAPGPNTSCPHPQHKVYPYLLRGVNVTRPNQVWSTDI